MMVVFFHRKRNNMWLMFKICSKKMTQVYDYKMFINYGVVEDPILRGISQR